MKKIFLFTTVLIISLSINTMAQNNIGSNEYKTALGVKFYPGAVSLKHFLTEKNAVEGLAYFFNSGMRITGLYEIHGNINGVEGLKWYIGPGAHIGFYNNNNINKYQNGTFIGVDGVLGLDYKIRTAPINLSLDWQPSFEFGDGAGFNGNWGGLAIRYVF